MSLKGNLQSVDLANVLQMLSINQKEGTLVLFDGDTRKSIYFSRDGVSMLSRGRRGQDTLGRILVRYGRISPRALEDALVRQRAEDRRLGEILQSMAAVSEQDIENAIRTQIEEEVYNLFIWKEASFEFIEGPPPPAMENVPKRVTFNVNSLIMEAQRRADEWNYIRGLVPSLDEIYRPTEKMSEAVVTDDVFHFPYAERVLASLQEGRLNVAEIVEVSYAAKFEACKILAILLEQGAVEPVTIADLQRLAQEASARNDQAQAAKFLGRIVDLGGATPAVNMSLGYALEALDEPERASMYFKAAAEAYGETTEPRHAFDAYLRVARVIPTDLPAVTQMVEIACNNPEILAANRHEVVEAGRTLAQCLRELGRLPASIQILHKLAQASPQDLPLRNMLVQAYADSGMNNEAMGELESMADACANQRNFDEAIRCLRRVAAIDRNRPGVLKRIESLTRQRDAGKRILSRIVAVVAVLASVGAAFWGFFYYRDSRAREQRRVSDVVSGILDPIRTSFDASQKSFREARKHLEDWKSSRVDTIAEDWLAVDAAVKGMETALEQTERKAKALFAEHGGSGFLSSNFVDERTVTMRKRLKEDRDERNILFERILVGTHEAFKKVRAEADEFPLASIPEVERILGILRATRAPTEVVVGGRTEKVDEFHASLLGYREKVGARQEEADALWAEGNYAESHRRLASWLADYPVTEFARLLRFRVRIATVPEGSTVRVLEGPGKGSPPAPTPADVEYTAAGGFKVEVASPGFEPAILDVPGLKGDLGSEAVLKRLPFQLRIVLTKVPAWTAALGEGGIDAPPVPTPDGRHLVALDRSGWVHLISVEDGGRAASWDSRSPSGFSAGPVVAENAVFVASADGTVACLDLPGLAVRWRKEPSEGVGPVYGTPVLAEGNLVVAGAGGTVAAFDAKTGQPLWEVKLPSGTRQPLLRARGWIVAFCEDGVARAVGGDGKETIVVLPTPREEPRYPPPKARPLSVGDNILFGPEGAGRGYSLVELPPRTGAASPHIGFRWGASEEGAEPCGAAAGPEDLFLLFTNGMMRRVSLRQGPRPVDRVVRVLPEKEKPLGAPVIVEGRLLLASERGIQALRRTGDDHVEIWKWTAPEGVVLSSPPAVIGKLVVVGSRDGRLHALLLE